jgi:hypothetical protein
MGVKKSQAFVYGMIAWFLPHGIEGAASAQEQSVQINLVAIDPAIHRLSDEELIDRLQEESQREVPSGPTSTHTQQPALAGEFVFIPVNAPDRYNGNLAHEPRSPIMVELVSRGVTVLPALLKHLSDARPTRLYFSGPGDGAIAFCDNFEARYFDEKRQPLGVNTVDRAGEKQLSPDTTYVVKVGDLCYGAIGQIVNRALRTAGDRVSWANARKRIGMFMGGRSVVNSPIMYPSLAAAARVDWSGVTAKEHELSLREDATRTDDTGHPDSLHAWSAIPRLLFYYPNAGRQVVETLLKRAVVDDGAAKEPLAGNEVTYYDQEELVSELAPFRWQGLDRIVYEVYSSAIQRRSTNLSNDGRLLRNRLALACAKRVAGQGHDDEFKVFFEEQIVETESMVRNQSHRLLAGDIERYQALLQTLNK